MPDSKRDEQRSPKKNKSTKYFLKMKIKIVVRELVPETDKKKNVDIAIIMISRGHFIIENSITP